MADTFYAEIRRPLGPDLFRPPYTVSINRVTLSAHLRHGPGDLESMRARQLSRKGVHAERGAFFRLDGSPGCGVGGPVVTGE